MFHGTYTSWGGGHNEAILHRSRGSHTTPSMPASPICPHFESLLGHLRDINHSKQLAHASRVRIVTRHMRAIHDASKPFLLPGLEAEPELDLRSLALTCSVLSRRDTHMFTG